MKKNIFHFALMAAMVCGLSLAATSCKDDDKSDNNGENMEQLASTGGDLTMDEVQLSSLISNFSAVQADELLAQSGWQQKTYDVDFGMVLDESRPTVRTVEVGTLEEADEEACALLDQLGIDFQSPSGFQFSSASVGTVSYQHGGGSDANTLAVINMDVKQLPGISQLRLVKQMPANAGDAPRYHLGDIIRKKGDQRLWLCVRQSSDVGGHAYFVSFWTDHPKDNCGWGSENDYVYKASKPMASQLTLGYWMALYLMNDDGYTRLTGKLDKKGVKGRIDDLIPSTQEIRAELIDSLRSGVGYKVYREPLESAERMELMKWDNTTKANGRIIAPYGRLLCDKFRWASGLYHDYWVPCLNWIDSNINVAFEEALNGEPSQNEGSHFKWKMSPEWNFAARQMADDPILKKFRVVCTAVYWQHKYYNNNQWAMFDFTKDWTEHPTQANQYAGKSKWLTRNITSSELVITDTGEALKGYDEVWVAVNDQELIENEEDKNDENKIHKEEVKLYSIIGTNGQFYDNVQAARAAGTKPMAIVTYLGETKRAERGKEWNGLAMALDKLPKEYQYTDEDHAKDACVPATFKGAQADKDFTGWETTQTLVGGCGKGHDHQAAKACNTYGADSLNLTARQTEFSSWFLPSYGQWIAAVRALGVSYRYTNDRDIVMSGYGTMEKGFTDAGVPNLWEFLKFHSSNKDEQRVWTSTAASAELAYSYETAAIWAINDYFSKWTPEKDIEQNVIPFIAFKYAGGGTIDQ